MKAKLTIIIAAFAIAISFAFITVNKSSHNKTAKAETEVAPQQEAMTGYAMEDQNQWD